MINNNALCMTTACSGTWVYAFLVGASLVQFTIGADCALWATVWWAAYKALHTDTYGMPTYFSTLTVWTTW